MEENKIFINKNIYEERDEIIILSLTYKKDIINTIFDKKFLDIIKEKHWRISKKRNKMYVCTGQSKNGNKIIYLQNLIMNFIPNNIQEVDHINGDSLDNTIKNLRIVNRINNIQNSCVRTDNKITEIRGISFDKRFEKYTIDFYYKNKRFYFKQYKNLNHAIYLRYLCEIYFLKEFRNRSNDDKVLYAINQITEEDKKQIFQYFKKKVKVE